ncbi:MAG: hypothetical protein QXQ29_02805 [Candidatus Bathyarchaeia archaeon]
MKRKASLRDVVEEVFSEALSSGFSRDFYLVFTFYIGRGLGGDLFEVFLEDPARVYSRVEEIYGFGAVFIFRAIYNYIRARVELDLSFDRFLDIVKSGDREPLRNLFSRLSEAGRRCNPCIPDNREAG